MVIHQNLSRKMKHARRIFIRLRTHHIMVLILVILLFILTQLLHLHSTHVTNPNNAITRYADAVFQLFLSPSPMEEDDDLASPSHETSSSSKTFFDVSPQFAIHIIGERHTGVDMIQQELQRCFGHAIEVKSGLIRSAHWWQSPSIFATSKSLIHEDYGIVVALFRNPYDWLELMRLQPQYALEHWNVIDKKPLEWKIFLLKPWTVNRHKFREWIREDIDLLRDIQNKYNPTDNNMTVDVSLVDTDQFRDQLATHSCAEDFYWFDVVPCSKKDQESTKMLSPFATNALYELKRDGSGKPYDNILQLRTDKIRHFHDELSIIEGVQHYLPFRYEDLISQGTERLLKQVEKALPGIKAHCKPTQPKTYVHEVLPYTMINHINVNINWTVEALVGYKKLSDKDWSTIRQLDKQRKEEGLLELSMNQDNSRYGIHIIGERHTGTLWLQRQLEKCFGHQIKIYPSLSRYKYWFQIDDPIKNYGLVIATFRNVYDWILEMMENPLHAPIHYNSTSRTPLSFNDFLQKKWSLDEEAWGSYLKDDRKTFLFSHDLNRHSCYDNFTFFDVSPCSYNDRLRTASIVQLSGDYLDNGDSSAVYEMKKDNSNAAMIFYDNILELRRDKIIHFMSEVPKFFSVKHFIPVKFEDMVQVGTESLIASIEANLHIQSQCSATKLQTKNDTRLLDKYTEDLMKLINQGVDWETEALVGYEKSTHITQYYGIHIIGERHTGTSWLHHHLNQCFGDQVKVYDRLSRHKYWFQVDDESKDYGLVVATSRNVYDWLYDMRENPLHAPIHYNLQQNVSMSFQEFIQTEWAPDRERWNKLQLLKDDQQLLSAYERPDLFMNVTQGRALEMQPCYDGFTFYDVIPCSYNDRIRASGLIPIRGGSDIEDGDFSPVYEMRKDHPKIIKPYKNILELRRDKMVHFFSEVPKFSSIQHFIPIKFEDMVDIGTQSLLRDIEKKMNLQSRCSPQKLPLAGSSQKRKYSFDEILKEDQGVDWNAEALMGYQMIAPDKMGLG